MATILVSITQAKVDLERLLAEADAGHHVVITRWKRPVVWLKPDNPAKVPDHR